MSQSRRQDREKQKRERERRSRARESKQLWDFSEAERERTAWPIERAWVPCPDVWSATGLGLVAVERRQPDGRFAGAFFQVEMLQEGLTMAADFPDCRADEFAGKLAIISSDLPPCRPGPVEAASCFVWGAYALSVENGYDWAAVGKLKQALALVPKPRGTPRQWAAKLWDDLTPDGLRRVITRAPDLSEIPDDKEIMIFTTATFDLHESPDQIIKALQKASPDFQEDGESDGTHFFSLTRRYPKKHWSPLALLGGRQIIGQVEVRSDTDQPTLVVSSKTISMTCVAIQKVKQVVGETIRLAKTTWQDVDDLREMTGS